MMTSPVCPLEMMRRVASTEKIRERIHKEIKCLGGKFAQVSSSKHNDINIDWGRRDPGEANNKKKRSIGKSNDDGNRIWFTSLGS
jgi:hypothetical protein